MALASLGFSYVLSSLINVISEIADKERKFRRRSHGRSRAGEAVARRCPDMERVETCQSHSDTRPWSGRSKRGDASRPKESILEPPTSRRISRSVYRVRL